MQFGTRPDGQIVEALTIRRDELSATILTQGAILQSVYLNGVPHSLTLGSDTLDDYLTTMKHFGPVIAPVGNRIAGARARIGGIEHMLTPNEGRNTLHSAEAGSQSKVWTVEDKTDDSVTLSVTLPDGEAGFPGVQKVLAHFIVLPESILRMEITATTDEDCLINICNHSYWNLNGTPSFEGHEMQINAQTYLPTNDESLPIEVTPVEGTEFDFRALRPVVPGAPNIDHNYCLSRRRMGLREVAALKGTDITMTLWTDMPGLQVYDARGSSKTGMADYAGLAFEPQYWPNAPHEPSFPKITAKAGEVWTQEVEWRFERNS